MLTYRQRILILLTWLAVIGAIATLIWAKNIDQQLQNPPLLQNQASSSLSGTQIQKAEETGMLVSNFEGILSQDQIAELYEGEQDFWFTSSIE